MQNTLTADLTEPSTTAKGVAVSSSTPARILRLEAVVMALAAIAAYRWAGGGWGIYVALWLLPDAFMVGYLVSPKVGSIAYNLSHNLVLPLALCAVAATQSHMLLLQLSLIWLSHVAIDRALGFGLKYATAFGHTHLGRC